MRSRLGDRIDAFIRHVVLPGLTLTLVACGAKEVPREDWGAITPDARIRVTTLDGTRHDLSGVVVSTERLEGNSLVGQGRIRVPLDSVEFVEASMRRAVLPVLASLAAAVTTVMIIDAMGKSDVAPPPTPVGSCPFIYSFDGRDYHLDSETFAGAVTRGLERTDLDNLEHLRPVDGEYRLRLVNERPETQHTDELILQVVDHRAGTLVLPDVAGRPRVMIDPTGPASATGLRGADVLAEVAERDDRFWMGDPVLTIDADDPSSFRDGMELTFPRPAGDRALLAVRSRNTELAPYVLERFLELFGEDLVPWYRRVDRDDGLQAELREWIAREGTMHVSVAVDGVWRRQDVLIDVGPHLPKTQVAGLDLADVTGEEVRIRLEGPRGLWTVDHVALGLEDEEAPTPHELRAMEARDAEGREVGSRLARADGVYVTALPGYEVDLTFRAPPAPAPGLERSVMARTSGFYHMYVEQSGPARLDVVERILHEPLFGNRYMLSVFLGTELDR